MVPTPAKGAVASLCRSLRRWDGRGRRTRSGNRRHRRTTEIRLLHRELGATFFCVTHDQTEALTIGDRVAVLRRGRLQHHHQGVIEEAPRRSCPRRRRTCLPGPARLRRDFAPGGAVVASPVVPVKKAARSPRTTGRRDLGRPAGTAAVARPPWTHPARSDPSTVRPRSPDSSSRKALCSRFSGDIAP